MTTAVQPVDIAAIEAARARLATLEMFSPLATCETARPGTTLLLKLENLQPVGSFKIRPIGNAVLAKPRTSLARGIYTISAGNSAVAVAWMARRLGVSATAVVPQNAAPAKLDALQRLGAHLEVRSTDEWWRAIEAGTVAGQAGVYIDAVRDPAALAGDGTIGLELVSERADLDAIFVPFGGGGLACGIACAVRAMRPDIKIIACELTSAQPLKAAFEAGAPVVVAHDAGFVSGVGFGTVLPEMWPLVNSLIDGVISVSLDEVAAAIKILAVRNRVVAEGAGAISVAAALSDRHDFKTACAIVSGGNIDASTLATILQNADTR